MNLVTDVLFGHITIKCIEAGLDIDDSASSPGYCILQIKGGDHIVVLWMEGDLLVVNHPGWWVVWKEVNDGIIYHDQQYRCPLLSTLPAASERIMTTDKIQLADPKLFEKVFERVNHAFGTEIKDD